MHENLSPTEDLRRWFEAERERGLVDVKFYPGTERDAVVRDAASDAVDVLRADVEANDVSDEPF
jgi:hypothetical protein